MGERRDARRILVGRPEGRRPLGIPRRRWEDNIKMGFQEIGWMGLHWINLAQDKDGCRAVVNAVMNLRVPQNSVNLLSSWGTVSFSRRTLRLASSFVPMHCINHLAAQQFRDFYVGVIVFILFWAMPGYCTLLPTFRVNLTLPSSGLKNKTESSAFSETSSACLKNQRQWHKTESYSVVIMCGKHCRNVFIFCSFLFPIPHMKHMFLSTYPFMLRVHQENTEWIKSELFVWTRCIMQPVATYSPFIYEPDRQQYRTGRKLWRCRNPREGVCQAGSLPSQKERQKPKQLCWGGKGGGSSDKEFEN